MVSIPRNRFMYRPRWRAFCNTVLEIHIHNLDFNTVTLCGYNIPHCHRTTIYEASERNFRIILAKNPTSVIYDIALEEVKSIEVMPKTRVRSHDCQLGTLARLLFQ